MPGLKEICLFLRNTMVLTRKLKKHGKSVLFGRSIRGTNIGTSIGALMEHIAAPIRTDSKSMHNVGMPVHILNKEDIKKEIAKGEKRFGMPVVQG